MRIDPVVLADICELARLLGVRGRYWSAGDGAGAADRLGIAVVTVYVHRRTARVKLRQTALRHEEFEFHRFGPAVSNPTEGLYRIAGPGEGERVRVTAGAIVTVQDLMLSTEQR